jgi:hypothetical protein
VSSEDVNPIDEVTESEFREIINHTHKLTISRKPDMDEETKELFHKLVGKAVMNGYKVTRKKDSIVLYREKGGLKHYDWGDSDQ